MTGRFARIFRTIAGLMLGGILLGFPCCSRGEVLRVGFGVDRPPYVFEKNGTGLEVDIITRAAALAGMKVEAVFSPNERSQRMLRDGGLDAVSTRRPAADGYYYSSPYIEYQDVAIALRSRHVQLHQVADLGHYSVATFQLAHEVMGDAFKAMASTNPAYREELDEKTLDLMLYTGQTDVLVGDRRIFWYFSQQLAQVSAVDVSVPVVFYTLWPPLPFQVQFKRQSQRDRFDKGLKALHASGEYDALLQAYAPPDS